MEYFKLLRPKHWVKNAFIFIPLFFAGEIFEWEKQGQLLIGFIAFSLIASSIYVINDYNDIAADRLHPTKRFRPLASGAVSPTLGLVIFVFCVAAGFGVAYLVKPKFMFIASLYFFMNLAYTYWLKNLPIVDIIILAAGFVLRIKAGGAVAEVQISQWLMVMVFLLAVFLALAKRRDDLLLKAAKGQDMRVSVKNYNLEFINANLVMISGVIIVAYLMYTLSENVIERMGTYRLYYTSVFVIAGVMRYLQITFVENDTGSPTKVLYKDKFIQLSLLLWVLSFYFILYLPDIQIFD